MGNAKSIKMALHSDGNQWDEVVFHKHASTGPPPKAAKNSRGPTEAVAKFDKSQSSKMGKLDDADEAGHIETVGLGMQIKIQQARLAKKMTQKQVATAINEKVQTVNEYESGKAVPNQQVLGKLERILGAKLRGGKKAAKKK